MNEPLASTRPLSREQLDPLCSPVLQRELPGLAAALSEEAMRDRLQALLFGPDAPYAIERSNPGQAIYQGGDFCGLRYEMEVRDRAGGELRELLVVGRVFRERDAGADYMHNALAPVLARAQGRPELAPFAVAAAAIEPLNMVVHAFPIDGELPQLLDVTERGRVMELVSEAAPAVRDGGVALQDCRVELAHYGRQHRCTLRYVLEGLGQDRSPARMVVYGKIASDGSGERTQPIIAALRAWQSAAPGASRINIPRTLGFRPDLQLLLLEAIPGKPQVAQLLKARLAGKETSAGLTLEDAIDACARIAASIHSSGIALGRRRTLESELDWLRRSILALQRISPDLGAQLQRRLDAAEARARATAPLTPCFSHGDFTYTQLVFDGAQSGLVDFDTVCQAEPALDLGQFLAYQRLAILKDQRSDRPLPAGEAGRLTSRFLDTYIDTLADARRDVAALRARVHLYETLMLLRLAIHSWQKLKVSRLAHALTLLEEQVP